FGRMIGGHGEAVEEGDARSTAAAGGDDDIEPAVAGHVAQSGAGAAAEVHVLDAEEVGHGGGGEAVEDADARAAALIGRDDDLGPAVAGHVAGSDEDAAAEGRLEGEEVAEEQAGLAVVDLHARPGVAAGGGDDVIDA